MKIVIKDCIGGNILSCFQFESGMGALTIGRSSKCDIAIPERYASISGIHATLRISGDNVQIMDGNSVKPSANGTYVNGQRLSTETWVSASISDSVCLGVPNASGSVIVKLELVTEKNSKTHRSLLQGSTNYSSPSSPQSKTTGSGHGKASSNINSSNVTTLSENMRLRLARIDKFLLNGYYLKKEIGAFPVFESDAGRRLQISLFNTPAGFSWIGFFFAFAVCTQIREWSYFYVLGLTDIIASIISVFIRRDISGLPSLAISIAYGVYLPYLRHAALSKSVPEIRRGVSILLGLCLSVLVTVPGALLVYFFLHI